MTTWRIADGVAWVGDAERVALIDTRRGAQAAPMLVHAPFARLWSLLAQAPTPEDALRASAAELAGDEADDFVSAFVDPLSDGGLIERVREG